jgi:hypothetical protein
VHQVHHQVHQHSYHWALLPSFGVYECPSGQTGFIGKLKQLQSVVQLIILTIWVTWWDCLGCWWCWNIKLPQHNNHNIVINFVTSFPWIIRVEELHDMK